MRTASPERAAAGRLRRPARTLAAGFVSVLAAAVLAACGSTSSSTSAGSAASAAPSGSTTSSRPGPSRAGGVLTLGTKDFTEEFILGELYRQALEAKGCTVHYNENIGATEIIDKALTTGQIDVYPEYTGESVATVAKITRNVTSPAQEYALAKAFYAKRGEVMSDMTPFSDVDAVAVKTAYATKYGLSTIADLKKVPHFTFGARPEFLNRQEGVAGMKSAYGITNLTFKSLALGIQYQALDSGSVDAIDVFTTDPQLASGKYTVLKDPKNIFGFQNVALVVDKTKLNACPSLMSSVNGINRLLTTPAIIGMNKAVAIDKQQPVAVARAFLHANHVI